MVIQIYLDLLKLKNNMKKIFFIVTIIIFIITFLLWLWMPLSDGKSSKEILLSSKEKLFFYNLEKNQKLNKIIITKRAEYKGRFMLRKYEYNIKISNEFDLYTWQSLSRNILNEFCDSKLINNNDKYNVNFIVTVIYPNKSKEDITISYNGYFTECSFAKGYF